MGVVRSHRSSVCRFIASFLKGALLVLFFQCTHAVEWSKFKTCADLGFCRRHRHFTAAPNARYALHPQSVAVSVWRNFPALTARLEANDRPPLLLVVLAFAHGIFRIVIDDVEQPRHERHVVSDILLPHVTPLQLSNSVLSIGTSDVNFSLPSSPLSLNLQVEPFALRVLSEGSEIPRVEFNAHHSLHVDDFASEPTPPPQPSEKDDAHSEEEATQSVSPHPDQSTDPNSDPTSSQPHEASPSESNDQADDSHPVTNPTPSPPSCEGCWSESFQSHTDPKLRGPESVGVDLSFPFARHLYGVPQRTVKFSLPNTVSTDAQPLSEPVRLYNLDVFEFELDKPLGLYGSIPFMYARNGAEEVATLWLNSAESYVDIIDTGSEQGPSASDIYQQYLWLTGRPAMPQRFALGYHQCRWNYRDDEDSRAVDAGFDKHDIPYDVLWLDIEHTNGKRYFTWDMERFPDPSALQNHIAARGRKLVTIVDPHIKKDDKYELHRIGLEQGLYVKQPNGEPYFGWCWPGSSGYFDYTSPKVRDVFSSMFHPSKYPHFTENLYTWNDMNEPSIFNGPEGTMSKDMLHEGGIEHRHLHNVYGHYFMQATFEGLLKGHGGNDRPFVLSRSFFSGSQKFGAVWTGDNLAKWDHLGGTVRMLLSLQVCGMVLSGADVGGFFGNPSAELLSRWYQMGAFQPFFRGHAHLDSNRREPWEFGEPYTSVIAKAIRTRYELIAYWYTLFAGNALGMERGLKWSGGGPPMRPMWWEFKDDELLNSMETQWMVGKALLCAPVLTEGATTHKVYLPDGEIWYDLYAPDANGITAEKNGEVEIGVDLDRMIVFQRGGTIVPKQERRRRSTVAMGGDGYTLMVALNGSGEAEGELYVDDGRTYDFEKGAFVVRRFTYWGGRVKIETVGGGKGEGGGEDGKWKEVVIERVVVNGYGKKEPSAVTVGNGGVDFVLNGATGVLTLQRLKIPVVADEDVEIVIVP